MPEDKNSQPPDGFAEVLTETHRFSAEEMVACEKCRRANPPTRMNCLYCGEKLPATEASDAQRRPSLRPLEEWEQGFNVVLLSSEEDAASNQSSEELASLVGMESGLFEEFLRRGEGLPLVRAASADAAELISKRLEAGGVRTEMVSDELLSVESAPPGRVRKLEMTESGLKGWMAGDESEVIGWDDVALIALGRVRVRRVEVDERRGRVKAGKEVADSREISSDESALEIYARGDEKGWRIMSTNFDYSCLGQKMGLLARENFEKLVEELRARARAASFDDWYDRVRPLLNAAWPPAKRTEAGGLRRERPGKFNTESVTVVSNDAQFTRYARLRRLLLMRERAG